MSTATSNLFCPHCHYPGTGVHYVGCPKLGEHGNQPGYYQRLVPTEADIRRIVREELERAKEGP